MKNRQVAKMKEDNMVIWLHKTTGGKQSGEQHQKHRDQHRQTVTRNEGKHTGIYKQKTNHENKTQPE